MKRPYRPPSKVCQVREADIPRLEALCEGRTPVWSTADRISFAIDAAEKFYGSPTAKIQGESVLEIKSVSQQLSLF